MDYRLTQHAQEVLQKRQIALAWVEKAFYQPEWTQNDAIDPDLEHRLARIPEFGDRLLRVVVNIKKTPPSIVTAFFDRRRPA